MVFSNLLSFSRVGALAGLIVAGAFLSGCGGGVSPDPDSTGPFTFSGVLSGSDFYDDDTDRYYDVYVCDAGGSDQGRVQMRSGDFDTYLYIYRKDSDGDYDLIASNDDVDDTTSDSEVNFDVSKGKTYRIVATTIEGGGRGDYDIRFSGDLKRPALVLPDRNRSNQSIALPKVEKKASVKKSTRRAF